MTTWIQDPIPELEHLAPEPAPCGAIYLLDSEGNRSQIVGQFTM